MMNDLATDEVEEVEDELEEVSESTDAPEEASTDNVGDPSVEINVEELISQLEAEGLTNNIGGCHDARKRLEELMEHKRAHRDIEDFDDYDV